MVWHELLLGFLRMPAGEAAPGWKSVTRNFFTRASPLCIAMRHVADADSIARPDDGPAI
jgi:hypothetical protein